MEPLLERGYSKVEPVLIPPYGGIDGQHMPQSPSSLNNVDPTLSPTGILFFVFITVNYKQYICIYNCHYYAVIIIFKFKLCNLNKIIGTNDKKCLPFNLLPLKD